MGKRCTVGQSQELSDWLQHHQYDMSPGKYKVHHFAGQQPGNVLFFAIASLTRVLPSKPFQYYACCILNSIIQLFLCDYAHLNQQISQIITPLY